MDSNQGCQQFLATHRHQNLDSFQIWTHEILRQLNLTFIRRNAYMKRSSITSLVQFSAMIHLVDIFAKKIEHNIGNFRHGTKLDRRSDI